MHACFMLDCRSDEVICEFKEWELAVERDLLQVRGLVINHPPLLFVSIVTIAFTSVGWSRCKYSYSCVHTNRLSEKR